MEFELNPIPEGAKRGWAVTIDGKPVEVGKIEIAAKFGTLSYGLRPEGYDSWAFRETGGGGAVTLPYTRDGKWDLLIGLLKENRPNMGDKPVWCAIGGFVKPNETHVDAQKREGTEESGINTAKAEELPGPHTNANRAFFVADAATEGVKAYGLHIPFAWLEEAEGPDCFKLKEGTNILDAKKAANVRFFPWRDAVHLTADALARSAIAQMLSEMLR